MQQCPSLRVDGEDQVCHLHVVVRPDITDGIGRVYSEPERVEVVLVAQAFKANERGGDHRRNLQWCTGSLDRAISAETPVDGDRPPLWTHFSQLIRRRGWPP